MPTRTRATSLRDLTAEIAYLTRALKAPTLRESADRLAERARAESWTHQEYLVACLQREVVARNAHGGEGRGKTQVAIGLGIRARQAGHRALFATASEWVARLADAHQANTEEP
jgi:hypothetical protein